MAKFDLRSVVWHFKLALESTSHIELRALLFASSRSSLYVWDYVFLYKYIVSQGKGITIEGYDSIMLLIFFPIKKFDSIIFATIFTSSLD